MRKLIAALLAVLCATAFCAPGYAAYKHKNVALVANGNVERGDAPDFINNCVNGLKMAKRRNVRLLSVKLFDIRDYKSEAEALENASKWANLVIIPTQLHANLSSIMREYPKTDYVTFEQPPIPGVKNISFRNEEVGFLAGVLAVFALHNSKDERIKNKDVAGAILGPDIFPIRQIKSGFETGVWYTDKKVKPLFEQVDSFDNKQAVAEAAKRLHAKGADVIFTAAGQAGLEASKSAEQEGFWTIGVDAEVERLYPKGVLASVVKRIDYVIDRTIDLYMQGKLTDKNTLLGAKDDVISVSTWTREAKGNLPLSIRKHIEEVEDKLITGLIVLPKK